MRLETAKNTLIALSGMVSSKLMSFIYSLIIARLVSQEDIGAFYFSLSLLSIIQLIATLGLPQSLSRYIPYLEGRGKRTEHLIKTVALFSLLTTLTASAALYFIEVPLISPKIQYSIKLLSPYIFLTTLFSLFTQYYIGKKEIAKQQLAQIANISLKLIFTIILLLTTEDRIAALSWGLLIPSAIISLFFIKNVPLRGRFDKNALREVVFFGFSFTLLSLSAIITFSIDRIMLGIYSDLSSTGIYSIISTMANALLIFSLSSALAHLPQVANIYGQGKPITLLTKSSQKWATLLALFPVLLITLFPKEIITIVYGEGYLQGAFALSLLALGVLFKGASQILSNTLIATKRIKYALISMLLSATLNTLLNYWLIPSQGIEGAALASLTSFIALFLINSFWMYKHFKYLSKEVSALLLSALLTYLTFPLLSLLSLLFPLLTIILTSKEEISFLKQKFQKLFPKIKK